MEVVKALIPRKANTEKLIKKQLLFCSTEFLDSIYVQLNMRTALKVSEIQVIRNFLQHENLYDDRNMKN